MSNVAIRLSIVDKLLRYTEFVFPKRKIITLVKRKHNSIFPLPKECNLSSGNISKFEHSYGNNNGLVFHCVKNPKI
jgi:hypothetical protein